MHTAIKEKIEGLARANPHEEICGFVFHNVYQCDIFQCKNVSTEPHRSFEISADDYLECLKFGTIIAIYHSHPANMELGVTQSDLDLSEEMDLPIRMFHVGSNEWHEYIPKNYIVPLEGQPFIWGEKDCFGLIRTYLRQEHGRYVRDYPRDETFPTAAQNVIMENFEREDYRDVGFTRELKKGDVLLFQCGRIVPQHFGIYTGNTRFLHHPINMLSQKDILHQKWLNRLKHVLRHKSEIV